MYTGNMDSQELAPAQHLDFMSLPRESARVEKVIVTMVGSSGDKFYGKKIQFLFLFQIILNE